MKFRGMLDFGWEINCYTLCYGWNL